MGIKTGKIFVISAPSGTGKTSIMKPFLKKYPEFVYSVSATTRKKRENEIDGVDYFFISEEEFKVKIEKSEFLEWECVYDYFYGTLKKFVEDTISAGKNILVEVEVKGALSIKKKYPESNLIFIEPPSFDELSKRLKNRRTEDEVDLHKRLERARWEMDQKLLFDKCILNLNLDEAIKHLEEELTK